MRKVEHKLAGFAPDADFTTPGVLIDCTRFIPAVDSLGSGGTYHGTGFITAPSAQNVGIAALAAACRGAVAVKKLDGSQRLIAGTQTKLYERNGANWEDITRVSGDYTGGAENRWRFAQFGNETYAVNRSDESQSSVSSDFANAGTNMPKASICEFVNGFLFLFDTNEGTYGDSPDRWWCSPLQNPGGDWTPAIATQCATNRLVDTPGPIRAGRRLGDEIIVYKELSMYRGRYVGPPDIWAFTLIPSDVGAVSQEAVVNLQVGHFFVSPEGFHLFDGNRPQAVDGAVRNWWQRNANFAYTYKTICVHDRKKANIIIFYVSNASTNGTLDSALVWNYKMNAWGRDDRAIEAAIEYLSGSTTYDDMGTLFNTWDDLPTVSYDSPFWTSNTSLPAVFATDHTLYSLTGTATSGSISTGWTGSDEQFSTLLGDRPKLLRYDSTEDHTSQHYYTDSLGDASTQGTGETVSLADRKFDFHQSARWHRQVQTYTGDVTLTGHAMYFEDDGER